MEPFSTIGLEFFKVILDGISVGSIYAMVALGFVLIYKATDVLNFAQGELMMFGVYFCFYLMTSHNLPFLLALVVTILFAAALGILTEMVFLKPLLGEPIFSMVMVTIALSMLMKSVAGLLWGHDTYAFPKFIANDPVHILGVPVMPISLLTIGVVIIFMIVLFIFFGHSDTGLAMMATAGDQDAAKIMGININRMFALAWAIAAIIAGVGGILYAQSNYVYPDIGFIGLKSFPAAILGGLDSIVGALCGGLIIGLLENMVGIYLEPILGGGIKEMVAFILLILILMVKPYGLFGTKEIEKV
ncbi:MAG: branched-chain amino acid ABC transporter permease [Thermodesulfobacteriota bacterium]|nr:branched-chain amino acid ABC transporter permease [Thermodesulfobacteriota bacterium]